ncbi:MAG: hypothetical protein C4543_08360 [Ignavibacteriales bacterium]|jgi:hypothetical protein|nr:hypothetical protein [Melioribacteraceae bacterium]RJP58363.1 MAG: hypothetical protein C4543_08360 [Ignavibacteriales bacterium]
MKSKLIITLLIVLFFIGCGAMNEEYQDKLDPNLLMELSDENSQNDDGLIQFLGKCRTEITAEMRTELEETGVSVESVIKDIFTATGTRKQIIELAKLESVIRLEKSQMNYPMNKVN